MANQRENAINELSQAVTTNIMPEEKKESKKLTLREKSDIKKLPHKPKFDFKSDLDTAEFLLKLNDKKGLKKITDWILTRDTKGDPDNIIPHAFYLRTIDNMKRIATQKLNPIRKAELQKMIKDDIKFLRQTDMGKNDPAFR